MAYMKQEEEHYKKQIITMPFAFVQIHLIIVTDDGHLSYWRPHLTFFCFVVNEPLLLCSREQNFQEDLN